MKIKIDADKLAQEIEKSMRGLRYHAIQSESFCIFEHNGKQVQINVTRDPDDFIETVIDGIASIEEQPLKTESENPTYPQHEKLISIKDQLLAIADFLDWLNNEKVILLASYGNSDSNWLTPDGTAKDRLLAEYFEIDPVELETEKRAMLAKVML